MQSETKIPRFDPEAEPYLGSSEGKHLLIEYGSYACIHCRDAQHVVESLIDKLGDDLTYVFRHKPLKNDPWAKPAAMLTELAKQKDRYWDAHRLLMRRPVTSNSDLLAIALQVGISAKDFEAALINEELHDEIEESAEEAINAGVTTTPSFFIAHELYSGPWDEVSLLEALHAPMVRKLEKAASEFAGWAPITGLLLSFFAVTALVIANSSLGDEFAEVWRQSLGFALNQEQFSMSLQLWINDGLMAIFFLVVGLEIKREFTNGELADPKRSSLPIGAAIGGMVVPALLFFAIAHEPAVISGWGIPMATDIAFSLGLLALLGRRVPLSVKVFLTALAIIDDLGAIAVIALFYGHGFHLDFAIYAGLVFIVLLGLNGLGVYHTLPYLLLGILLWVCVYQSGIHATVAGILLALTIPTRSPPNLRGLLAQARAIFQEAASESKSSNEPDNAYPDEATLHAFDTVYDRIESPAHRIERKLEPWSSFLILPIFALTNAAVVVLNVELDTVLSTGVIIGLVLGKPLGIVLGCFLVMKIMQTELPHGMNWPILTGIGCLAGVGFTMSLFISNQAFSDPSLLGSAKLAVLVGSLISASIGLVMLYKYLPRVGKVSKA